jgi:hypothetical protein
MHNALVTVEVALSLALLIGAGLMVRSLWNLEQVNLGFDPHHVLSVTMALPQTRYAEKTQQVSFYETALDRIRALPGVRGAAGVDNAPLQGGSNVPIVIEGRPAEAFAQQPVVPARTITPGYFEVFRIPLLRGRDISVRDRADTVPVAVISKSLAERYWRDRDPIGKHIVDSFQPKISWTIVGVVGDVKDRGVDGPGCGDALFAVRANSNRLHEPRGAECGRSGQPYLSGFDRGAQSRWRASFAQHYDHG